MTGDIRPEYVLETEEDMRHLDELTTCPCAYCSSYCASYEQLESCLKRRKWKDDMDRKYYRK